MAVPAASELSDERQLILLATALAIGLLIGIERGWHGMQEDRPQVAGVRTFGLIGLLGGVTGLAARDLGQPVYGLAFIALGGVMAAAYIAGQRDSDDRGITSLTAALLTFALGTLATLGHTVAAAAAGVVTALLLGFKPVLHRWVEHLAEHELLATLKLLLLSVVLLPILPDRGFGPGAALNPYEIWWMVVLIASISYSGYFAVKGVGADRGTLLTGLLAGLASSTAVTLHFARLARRDGADHDLLAAGILFATVTLFPRILVIAAALDIRLAAALALPMAVMALVVAMPALLAWRNRRGGDRDRLRLDNPLELGSALRFGAFLAVVMVSARLLGDAYGGSGLLALGAASGLVDLNAITLSAARMSQDGLDPPLAALAVIIASISNGLFKSAVTWFVGGYRLGLRVALPVLAACLAGPATLWAGGSWPAW